MPRHVIDSGPFPTAPQTAYLEREAARRALTDRAATFDGIARDLRDDIADGALVIHARHRDRDGTLHTLGAYPAPGTYVLLVGEGRGQRVRAQFATAAQARQFFRAEILHEPPTGRQPLVDLHTFAAALTARLPGWRAQVKDITLPTHQAELASRVWDLGTLHGAFQRYALHEAILLNGPHGTNLIAVRRPGNRDQLLLGALRPAFVNDDDTLRSLPLAIAVGRDPVRAAAALRQRFLPRYDTALWHLRVQALNDAADGITEARESWDALSDSLCDTDGWPLDNTAYEEGKVERDAAAWGHVETFLLHAPIVLAAVREHASVEDYLDSPISEDLDRLRGIDTVLDRASAIRRSWHRAAEILATAPGNREAYLDRARERRNAEGWHYADELTHSGAALAHAAHYLTERIDPPDPRATAALSRTSTRAPVTPPAISRPPAAPSSVQPRRTR